MFLEVNPCFQKAHVFCMDLQPAADPYNFLCKAEVNSRQRLNFTEGTIIFYHFPSKRAVNICFIHPIHRFFSPYRTVKSGNKPIESKIRKL